MYIERREANDWPWAREILVADNVHKEEKLMTGLCTHVHNALSQSKHA
jgi:hypothetical protein